MPPEEEESQDHTEAKGMSLKDNSPIIILISKGCHTSRKNQNYNTENEDT